MKAYEVSITAGDRNESRFYYRDYIDAYKKVMEEQNKIIKKYIDRDNREIKSSLFHNTFNLPSIIIGIHDIFDDDDCNDEIHVLSINQIEIQ